MNTSLLDKVWRITFTIIFVVGTAWTPDTSARAYDATLADEPAKGAHSPGMDILGFGSRLFDTFGTAVKEKMILLEKGFSSLLPDEQSSNAYFEVGYEGDVISGWDWASSASIDINVNGNPVTSVQADEGGVFVVYVGDTIDLVPGDNIQVSDGTNTKTHTVAPLNITGASVDTDIVTGTATPNYQIKVWACGPTLCADRWETADGEGNWSANFSITGNEPGEEQVFDIAPRTNIDAGEWDGDGDYTLDGWYVPNPHIVIFPVGHWFEGLEWPDGAVVTITVTGKPECNTEKQSSDGYFSGEFNEGCSVAAGDTVTFEDGTTTRTHIVQNLTVTEANKDTDTLAGTANSGVTVYASVWGAINTGVTAANGSWLIDFGALGVDLVEGTEGRAAIRDAEGNETAVDWRIPQPRFAARYRENHLDAWEWQPNSNVEIRVNGDFITTAQADEGGNFAIDLGDVIYLLSGDVIQLSDGVTTKVHTVTPLSITGANVDTDIVTGTGTSNGRIHVWTCWDNGCAHRWENVDSDGNWSANFAVQGDEDGEEETADVVRGTGFDSSEWDEDGDNTAFVYSVPNPHFGVWVISDEVNGWEWTPQTEIQVSRDNCSSSTQSDELGNFHLSFGDVCDLQPGETVTVSDGNTTKQHVITNLVITGAEAQTDTVSGSADTGSVVNVSACLNNGWCANRHETADGDGNWTANFAIPGDEQDEQGTINLQPTQSSHANQVDEDGDFTQVSWTIPNPRFEVRHDVDDINGWEWKPNAEVSISMDGNLITTTQTNEWGDFYINVADLADAIPGSNIEVTDGTSTKAHIVTDLQINNVNLDADLVSGVATPNGQIHVWACEPNRCTDRWEDVDSEGNWTSDFSIPGDQGGEEQTINIGPGSWVDSHEWDEDGDNTADGYSVPNPRFEVRYDMDEISGTEWKPNTEVNISIDEGITTTALTNEWGDFQIVVTELADLAPGSYVELTDGTNTKGHTVTDLHFNNVSLSTDVASGIATPNGRVHVWTCWQDGCANRWETVGGDGNWSANFAVPGDEGGEEQTFNFVPGTGADSRETDEDGDSTLNGYYIPNPHIEVLAFMDRIALVDWPAGQNVHITVGNPAAPEYEQDFLPDQEGAYYEFIVPYDLETGDLITATNGQITKTLEIALLEATEVNRFTGTVSGAAAPDSQFNVDISGDHFDVTPVSFVVDVDSSGNWTGNYGDIPGSILPWTWSIVGTMQQWDADGDLTIARWHNHWPVLEVWLNEAELRAHDWPLGATLTFTIDDPTTPQPVDFTQQAQTTPMNWMDHGEAIISVRGSFALQPGMTVTVTDGTTTKSTVIQAIGFNQIDAEANTVQGYAPANADLDIIIGKEYWSQRYFSADANGAWLVDYNVPDVAGRTLDLQPGDPFHGLFMRDEEFDSTVRSAHVPNPSFSARLMDNEVHGYDWFLGSQVTLTIDDPDTGIPDDFTDTQTVVVADWDPMGTFVRFALGSFVLEPGQQVTMTDGIRTKTHTVTSLTITAVDPLADTITGTADPGSLVEIGHLSCDETGCYGLRRVNADGDGNWVTDFSVPGEEGDEQDLIDIVPGMGNEARQPDEDGDTTNVGWYVPNPRIEVRPEADSVAGWDWLPNTDVSITVDDVLITSVPTDGGGYFHTILSEMVDLIPGSVIEVTDGDGTKVHTLIDLSISNVDLDADTASGTATPEVRIMVEACGPNGCVPRWETVAEDGSWSSDFSVTGDEGGEEQTFDIVPGTGVHAREWDEDGDNTISGYYIPNPRFVVFPEWEWFDGHDWPDGVPVTITVAGKPVCDTQAVSSGSFFNGPFGEGCDLVAGDVVTFTDGTTTRTHTVRNLGITTVDEDTDIIAGLADEGAVVYVWPHATGQTLEATADSNGNWDVDFTGTFDLVPGEAGRVEIRDEFGNATAVDWWIVKLWIRAHPVWDSVDAWNWPQDANLHLTIDDPNTEDNPDLVMDLPGTVDPDLGSVWFDFAGQYDLKPGDLVTLTDGTTTHTLVVSVLSIDAVDVEADTASGVAEAGALVRLAVPDNELLVTADADGNWFADFQLIDFDVTPGTTLIAEVYDEDDDNSSFERYIPDPRFEVRAAADSVAGWDWQPNASVSITVDDVFIANAPTDQWGYFNTVIGETVDLVPGSSVEVTDGVSAKAHTVTSLNINSVDVDTELVTGTATANGRIQVWTCWENGCANRWETVDSAGHWSADFSVQGNEGGEEQTADIGPGSWVESGEWDEDRDNTIAGYNVPNPRFDAWYRDGHISAYSWPVGTQLTLEIDDPDTEQDPDFSTTTDVIVAPWDPNETVGEFNLNGAFEILPGMTLTVSGGAYTKDLLVSNLTITDIDLDNDIITGGTEPNQQMWMYFDSPSGQCCRNFQADTNGIWTVDYSQPGPNGELVEDIRPGSSGTINAIDDDGDDTSLYWRVPNPNFSARVIENEVHGSEWTLGDSITLTIDDPNTPEPIDFFEIQTVIVPDWDPNQTFVQFRLWETGFDLEAGMTVNMSDGQRTKTHVVTSLTVTNVDPDADTVSGTAVPGSLVEVGHIYCDDTGCYGLRRVDADGNGNWVADFSTPGQAGDEQDIIDLVPGTGSEARQFDDDWDSTNVQWRVLNPFVEVAPYSDWIHARDWPLGTLVTLEIDDPSDGTGDVDYTATDTVHQAPWNPGDPNDILAEFFWPDQFVPGPGYLITASGDGKSKTLTVSTLMVTEINRTNDTISGIATPNAAVEVCINQPNRCISRYTTADADGNWTVDYGVAGPQPNEQETFNIDYDIDGWVAEYEDDGDRTWVDWNLYSPNFIARLGQNMVEAYWWEPGTLVTVTIDDPATNPSPDYTDNGTAELSDPNNPFSGTQVFFELGDAYTLKSGDEIVVSGGGVTKTTTVADLHITSVDIENDVISGTAGPGITEVSVRLWSSPVEMRRDVPVVDGLWTADFSVPSGEFDAYDLGPGDEGVARWWDEDWDMTSDYFRVPNPTIGVRANTDSVEGWEWPLGATVTITVEDPDTPLSPDIMRTAVVYDAPWNPGEHRFDLGLDGEFDIQPGHIVMVTDGVMTKTHIVTDHAFTDIDMDADTVTGTAEPGSRVEVWACDAVSCINRHVDADSDGVWVADFMQPGDEGDEQDLFDITFGTWVDSSQPDEDGDVTMFGQTVPYYTLHAVPTYPEVHGHDWPLNADVTLTIDNDLDPNNGVLYTQTKNVSDNPWCGEPCFDLQGVFTLEIGQYVTMTDGEVTKRVQISTLQITGLDPVADTISGIADPGSRVAVNIWSQDGLARYVTADPSGNWIADFSVFGDEDFEQFTADLTYGDDGRAIQLNPDGTDDGTLEYWYIDWIAPDTIPLVVAIPSDVDLSRPQYTVESWTILNLLYEPFYRLSGDGTLTPAAATGYTVSPDGLVYTVTLRNDTFWTDSEPVTAQHYVDGLLRILHPETAADYAYLLFDIQGAEEFHDGSITDPNSVGITALNSNTLQITLKHPAVYFPSILATPALIPARLDLIDQFGAAWTDPINLAVNGPYHLLEHDKGHFVLQKNPFYYGVAEVAFEHIGFDIIADENERFESYKRGDVDVLIEAPSAALSDPNYLSERVYSDSPGLFYIGLNVQRGPTSSLLVRQALAAATNREALLNDVLNMPWRQTATGVIPPEFPAYQGSAVGFGFNPTLAQDLLAQAGYPGGVGLPTIHLYGSPSAQPTLDAVAEQWRTVLNISVETHYMSDFGAWIANCEDDPGACDYNGYRQGWFVDYYDSHNIINDLFNPDTSFAKRLGWDNARYRELIDLSRGEQNQTQRTAYLREAEQILVEDDTAVIPLYFLDRVSLVDPRFTTAFGLVPYFDQWDLVVCRTLTTDMNPAGAGTITADPLPNCPTEAGKYLEGTVVTLTASANPGWEFSSWTGDTGGINPVVMVSMDADKSVTANFTQIEYTLTLSTVGSGTLTANVPGPYHYGDTVQLTATPALGWSFANWSGDASGTTNPLTITIDGNKSVTANFTQNEYNLTVTVVGNGVVNRNNPGPYHYGDVVQLTAVPDAGWQFANWSGHLSGSANPTSITMDGDKSVGATFTFETSLIFADGFETGNFSAWSSCTVDGGDLSVSEAAKLMGNYGMQALLDDNVSIYCTSDHPNGETRYLAGFSFDPNSITMVNGDSHTIFGGYHGTTLVLRVVFRRYSNTYQVRASLLNDGSTWKDSVWFTITDAPHQFELDWRAATTAGANNGELLFKIDGSQVADLTAVDNDMRKIDRARLGAVTGVDTGTRGTYYFDEFTSSRPGGGPQPTFTLTINKTGTGSGTVTSNPLGIDCGADCAETFVSGTVVTLTATAAADSTFTGWSGGGCSGTDPCVVTLTADTLVTANFDTTPQTDVIFEDGFESGTFANWSSCVTDGGDLSVTTAAKYVGTYGMQALIDDNISIYCTSDHPNGEARYLAGFFFDPNSISMVNADSHTIFAGYSGTTTVLRVQFRRYSNTYQIRASLLNDGSTWKDGTWFTITDAPHQIEVDWRAASAAGANNGEGLLKIDGSQVENLTAVDNDTRRIDRARLGGVTSIDTGTRGTYFFDEFTSSRGETGPVVVTADFSATPITGTAPLSVAFTNLSQPAASITGYLWDFGDGNTSTDANPTHIYNAIGMYTVSLTAYSAAGNDVETKVNYITVSTGTDVIFQDGFDSCNLSTWSSSTTDAGDLSATASAALDGACGMQALIDNNTSIFVTDTSPNSESRYRARFWFDPNSITMVSGNLHRIFYGYSGTTKVVLRLEFRRTSAGYELRAGALTDGSAWMNTGWFPVTDAPHAIEIDWWAATAAGANNGGLTLWLDGVQKDDLTTVDNDTLRIDQVRLGAVNGIDTGTRGTYYFDKFESRRQTYIGP